MGPSDVDGVEVATQERDGDDVEHRPMSRRKQSAQMNG